MAYIATKVAPAIVIAGNGHVRRDYGVRNSKKIILIAMLYRLHS